MTYKNVLKSASLTQKQSRTYIYPDAFFVGKEAALLLVQKVKEFSDAVVVLPTGATPLPFYEAFIELYKQDETINLSCVSFFNLDEYVGLPNDHPLSYNFYMRYTLYDKLNSIDSSRAPKEENIYIPYVSENSNPIKAALKYDKLLESAVQKTGRNRPDIAFLGIGGISPVRNDNGQVVGYKGAHIGFNEPNTPSEYRTHLVRLTEKTRKDTQFRFLNLNKRGDSTYFSESVPEFALTMGIKNIKECATVVVMATGESKALVVKEIFRSGVNSALTASLLFNHDNVKWLFDTDAAFLLPADTPVVKKGFSHSAFAIKWNKIIECMLKEYEESNVDNLLSAAAKKMELDILELNEEKKYFQKHVAGIDPIKDTLMPKNSNVLIFSPHPDDDVIAMGATIDALKKRGNRIKVAYMVTGENSVRETDHVPSEKIDAKHKEFMYKEAKCPDYHQAREIAREAKIETRKEEAKEALAIFDVLPEDIMFIECDYYYLRGFVDIDPLHENDKEKVFKLFEDVKPDYVFYSAEHDPNGAHGIGAKLICHTVSNLPKDTDITFYGYCGAYKEWNIAYTDRFAVVPFDEKVWKKKEKAIKCHKSQLEPEFPGGDVRPFYARVYDRNRRTGQIIKSLGFPKDYAMAEVFKIFSLEEFLKLKY